MEYDIVLTFVGSFPFIVTSPQSQLSLQMFPLLRPEALLRCASELRQRNPSGDVTFTSFCSTVDAEVQPYLQLYHVLELQSRDQFKLPPLLTFPNVVTSCQRAPYERSALQLDFQSFLPHCLVNYMFSCTSLTEGWTYDFHGPLTVRLHPPRPVSTIEAHIIPLASSILFQLPECVQVSLFFT